MRKLRKTDPTILKRTAQVAGSLLVVVSVRVALLPFPLALSFDGWAPAVKRLEASQVARTEYFRGFFQTSRTLDAAQSRAILAVLQDSMNFRGDTTPNFTQLLIYYDAEGRMLGYTDLDVLDDHWLVAGMVPGGFWRGSIMHGTGRQQLLRLLGFRPPFTTANLRRQQ